ncbi:hypothetical protein TorRG33x02_186820, partial [Trema orientale]
MKFDYPRDSVTCMDSIEQLKIHYLRDWRSTVKVHFKMVGGKEDLPAAKANPYKNIILDDWNILYNHFPSEELE